MCCGWIIWAGSGVADGVRCEGYKPPGEVIFVFHNVIYKNLALWYKPIGPQYRKIDFLIHILKYGVPKLGIYEEIIKNMLNK